MKIEKIALLLTLGLSTSTFAAIGLPVPFECKNTSTGKFLYSINIETVEKMSVAVVRNQDFVAEIASRLGVVSNNPNVPFSSIRVSSLPDNCQSNDSNAKAMRCHPELELTFIKDDGSPEVSMPVEFLSLWSTREIHETAFTTWDEYRISLGIVPIGGKYSNNEMIIDHPKCR